MKNDVKVSIIMPVYNVEQYVERAILSVLTQTYQTLELIIVDDCGTDKSIDVVKNTLKKYDVNNISKVYHHTHNRGLSAARNTGLEHATGNFVFFLDSDDEIYYNCIELLLMVVNNHPGVDMVVGNMTIMTRDGSVLSRKRFFSSIDVKINFSNNKEWILDKIFNYSENSYIPSLAPNKLYSITFLKENNLHFVEGLIHEDEKFLFDMSECIQSIGLVFEPTYIYYETPNSIMSSIGQDLSASYWIKIIRSSYPNFGKTLIELKYKYTLLTLKRLMYSISLNASISDIGINLKSLIYDMFLSAKRQGLYKVSCLYLFLYILPYKYRGISFVKKIYKYIYNYRRIYRY